MPVRKASGWWKRPAPKSTRRSTAPAKRYARRSRRWPSAARKKVLGETIDASRHGQMLERLAAEL